MLDSHYSKRMNDIRITERCAILDSLREYAPFLTWPDDLQNYAAAIIERGLYNITIDHAKINNVPTYWGNSAFLAQYASLGYTIKINIDVNSSINKNKSPEINSYAVSRINNYFKILYFRYLMNTFYQHNNILTLPGIFQQIIAAIPYFELRKVGSLSASDINPHINVPYISQLDMRAKQSTVIKYSTMYKCLCGESKTHIYELQTRSFDEGATIFVRCISCCKVWTTRT
jgi:DNA-directed RNA polymerase subunit M/transcription elongation factor TFIIS